MTICNLILLEFNKTCFIDYKIFNYFFKTFKSDAPTASQESFAIFQETLRTELTK